MCVILSQFVDSALTEPRERAFNERLGAAEWTRTSSTRMRERATAIAYGLRAAGVKRGDRVVLIANNSVDWLAADFGIHFAGCVVVPIFATLAPDQTEFIFADSDAKLAFVQTQEQAQRLAAQCPSAPRLVHFDGSDPDSLRAFEADGAALAAVAPEQLASFTADVAASDLAVLIYTSGTTGNPKGVMLLHSNVIANAEASSSYYRQGVGASAGDPVLAVLPFAHIYEHNNILSYLLFKSDIYVTTPDYLLEDLKAVRPKYTAFVPRMFERILAGIAGKAALAGGLRARLVPWALSVAREHAAATLDDAKAPGMLSLQYAVAQRLVLAKIKLGAGLDRIVMIASGSAPLHRDIALTFVGIGLPVVEGYGLTETSPVLTVNQKHAVRYGSVGKPIPGVELKIAEDGEILAKGPNVMKGYYNTLGEQPFTDDGWFKTGDIGELDADGFLYITDRKKELIKTSAGKYVAPGRVESALKRSVYIGQCFIFGDGRPFPIALVCPNWDLVRRELEIPAEISNADLSKRSDVLELIGREVKEKTADLATFEQIRRVALLPRDLTIEDGELSQTMKVKRRVVEKKYAEIIDSAYTADLAAR
jgi:long-chain acyl-CoA synthetase